MTTEEQVKKIEEIYNDTIIRVKNLELEQKKIVSDYIKKIEQEKIERVRKTLLE